MNVGTLFMMDDIQAIREVQRRLRLMRDGNLSAAKRTQDNGERLQIVGQADGYDFVAGELDKMLWGQDAFLALLEKKP